ncbi:MULTISPECIES: hypothetical protein [unclassified Methylobacterium]|uniref:hypothetical protein n=1 Tax=unclassified Methylobacterium TaxID=2615210 RepID=UPI0006F29B0E|nr:MULTISPECIES: hypothetical protein [unclassified Methylobacterium]KQO48869.1 hypothetical protein ASF24_06500 [Methylobacterium sp. Leaf86]KQO93420.1 hypothetical protein ASF32_04205 [Methylobacterium sp. Leaf91]MBO1019154.1 hypothetical protein [Methylobacterium sp. SD274]
MRTTLTACLFIALTGAALAQQVNEPPIQSPQDAACREQARAQVFSAANPSNLSLYDLGSQIYHACMASYHTTGPNPDRKERRF